MHAIKKIVVAFGHFLLWSVLLLTFSFLRAVFDSIRLGIICNYHSLCGASHTAVYSPRLDQTLEISLFREIFFLTPEKTSLACHAPYHSNRRNFLIRFARAGRLEFHLVDVDWIRIVFFFCYFAVVQKC